MATNVAGRRYRTWYAMLLRLYPRPFRERFGEGMAQTFHDLCREHRDARRGLFGLALWIFSRRRWESLGRTQLICRNWERRCCVWRWGRWLC